MEKLSRRSFFRLSGGAIAAAVVAPKILLDKVIQVPVELGWTWYIDKSKLDPTFSELISHTLRNNKDKIVDNMFEKNALLMRLKDGQKVQLNIERIDPGMQTERMKRRIELKAAERQKKMLQNRLNNGGKMYPVDLTDSSTEKTFYQGYVTDLEKKYGAA